jgi:hypothetical protein
MMHRSNAWRSFAVRQEAAISKAADRLGADIAGQFKDLRERLLPENRAIAQGPYGSLDLAALHSALLQNNYGQTNYYNHLQAANYSPSFFEELISKPYWR